jgi:hypothetical protein
VRNKNRTAFFIKYKGNQKLQHTAGEDGLADAVRDAGYEPVKKDIRCSGGIVLHADWVVETGGQEVVIEYLGPHHFTPKQEAKTRWRSTLIAETGRRVILVGYLYSGVRWAEHLRAWLWHAIRDPHFGILPKTSWQGLIA